MKIGRKAAVKVVACVIAVACVAAGVTVAACSLQGPSTKTSIEGDGGIEVVCTSDLQGVGEKRLRNWVENNVYDEEKQAKVAQRLEDAKDGQTIQEPLVEYNPFGTNAQSLYVYFVTEELASVSYTVSVSDEEAATIEDESFTAESIPDFTHEAEDGEFTTEHEFQAIGLIPEVVNTVTVTATYEDGASETCVLSCDMCDVLGVEELQLDVEEGESDAELEDGLYVILGNDIEGSDFTYCYDNEGFLRCEVPLVGYRMHRVVENDGLMYFSYKDKKIAAMNELGQVERTYSMGKYKLHHDYILVDDDKLFVLATDETQEDETVEDRVVSLDLGTGDVELVVNMGKLLGSYKKEAIAYHKANSESDDDDEGGVDWLHLNSLQYIAEEDSLLLSSRETSSIFKISDVSTEPELEYILSSEEYWEDTEYADYVYAQKGDFLVHGGQHTIVYVEDESLAEGQYYLYFFDNNIGISQDTTSDFDYDSVGLVEEATEESRENGSSYYYKYLIDENAQTFELADSLEVMFSGYVSSAQELDENLVVDCGTRGVFAEYDSDKKAIRTFTMHTDKFIYRVFKYDW